jgi:hypothetical protein
MSSSHQREYASFSRAELQFLSDARSSSVKAVGRFPLSDHNFYSWAEIAQLFFEEFNTFDPRENDAAILKKTYTENPWKRLQEFSEGKPIRFAAYLKAIDKRHWIANQYEEVLAENFRYPYADCIYYPLDGQEYNVRRHLERVPYQKDEQYDTSTRVWSKNEDKQFRDIMAITPLGSEFGVANLLSSLTGKVYDTHALADYWRRNRRRIVVEYPIARPGRFNHQQGLGVANQPVRTESAGPEIAEWHDGSPEYEGTFYEI